MIAIECPKCGELFMLKLGEAHERVFCPVCLTVCSVPVGDERETVKA